MNDINADIQLVQHKCLEILTAIDTICKNNGIEYSLTGGSVIGYHLYNGFIPWDDDIDIMMTRKNYQLFLEACKTQLNEKYSVKNLYSNKDTPVLFSKIVDETTTVVEKTSDGSYVLYGVFVDITCFDCSDATGKVGWLNGKILNLVRCSYSGHYNNESVSKCRRFIFKVASKFRRPLFRIVENNLIKASNDMSKQYYAEVLFGLQIPYERDLLQHYERIVFGGVKTMIVKDYMKYLKTRYGRTEFYKENRGEQPHHYLLVDTNKPYKEQNLECILH